MPLDFARMLLQPTPATPWNFQGGGGEMGMARQQLKLQREKFEWEKKRTEEEDRLAREKMGAAATQSKLEAEANKAAKLQEDRLKVYGDFTKAAGEGNAEATRAMVPLMHSLGMGIELEGEEGGLPRYRVDMDAGAAQQAEGAELAQTSPYGEGETAEQSLSRLGAMGLGGETGSLLPPLGIRSSDEVEPSTGQSVASRVAATYGTPGEKTPRLDPATGQPMVDEEDFTGGVPKNVIDMAAGAAATLHRLDPSLKAAAAAYPDAQTSAAAEQIRLGLRSSGLPLEKQQAAFDKAISGPASQRNAQIGAEAQAERFRETRDDLTEKDKAVMRETGRKGADELAQRNDVPGGVKALRTISEIEDLIDDPSPENDTMIAGALMGIQDVKGIPSDKDLAMAFGMSKASTITQILDFIGTKVQGGFQPAQREAIESFIARVKQSQEEKLFGYLDSADTISDYNEYEQEGYRGRSKRAVDGYIYNAWLDKRKQRDEGAGGDASAELSGKGGKFDPDPVSGDFDIELESQAMESDLDPEKIKRIIGPESGGKANARNGASGATGLIQFLPSIARGLGTSTEKLSKMSAAEQLPFVMKYFSDRGITSDSPPEDYAMAVAAPAFIGERPGAVVYRKGSKEWEQNPAWRPSGGGDITVGSIQAYHDRDKGKAAAKSSALPEPKSALDKSVLDILRRAGD